MRPGRRYPLFALVEIPERFLYTEIEVRYELPGLGVPHLAATSVDECGLPFVPYVCVSAQLAHLNASA